MRERCEELLKPLIEAGADVETKDKNGRTVLMHVTAEGGSKDFAKQLIEKGADVNAKNDEGETALTFALMNDSEDVLELLFASSAKE